MPTTADYLTQLQSDRNDLADNLVIMGVAASHSETFTSLVPKVLTIPSGSGGGYSGVAVIPIQSIAEAMPTNTTVTV